MLCCNSLAEFAKMTISLVYIRKNNLNICIPKFPLFKKTSSNLIKSLENQNGDKLSPFMTPSVHVKPLLNLLNIILLT